MFLKSKKVFRNSNLFKLIPVFDFQNVKILHDEISFIKVNIHDFLCI